MRLPPLLAGCILAAFAAGPDRALADVLIKVDKSTQRMLVTVDGKDLHSWPVSTGLPRYSTPTGSFTPFRLEEDHFSKEWDDAPMPHSIFFTSRGHAIHGSDATGRLGSPASHGCIRLSRANAAVLFDLVREEGLNNTKVVVTGEEAAAVASRTKRTRTASRPRAPRTVERIWVQRDPAATGSVQGGPFDRYAGSSRATYAPASPYGWRGGYGGGW
ncbi:MAG: L,D-transpeptidase [Pseudomonadota bacterium]|nr:L,D-transpeptidase [Pseudomonadota bacterium]